MEKFIRNESDNLWKVNPDVFESDDAAHRAVFNRIPKRLEVGQKYTGPRLVFKTLLVRVWKCVQTRSCVLDILHQIMIGKISTFSNTE